MKTINGKYNFAHIMCDEIEQSTEDQIKTFLDCPVFKDCQIRIMSDCHAGKGAVIGFTATMNDYIIPQVIGVDIGCSIETYKIGQVEIDFPKFDKFLTDNIPMGFNINEKPRNEIIEMGKELTYNEFLCKLTNICNKIKLDYDKVIRQISSLGSGNHFLELNQAENGDIWFSIHSGSRNFGLQVANYHQEKARKLMKKFFIQDEYKDLEFLPMDMGGEEYLQDMRVAQEFAVLNRHLMAKTVLEQYFGLDINKTESIKSIHNYIDLKDKIIRKGAISAHEGERVIIPLNMRDGIIIGRGKGSQKWNSSSPHGSGRVMGRNQAKKNLDLKDFQKSMVGIYSSCVDSDRLDESPMVYKPMNMILESIKETVDVEFVMKSIFNRKG